MADFDLAIVGGGINGTGIARDAAGRGLKVLLVEQGDLASGTSSASTKLIHGGLRYLEHGWFRLVREALIEREVMLRMAPHLISPLRFVLPPAPHLRAPWLLRLGLFIYDHLGGRKILPPTRTIDLGDDPLGAPLKRRDGPAYEYSDCWADDSRLVVLNALDAAERGAVIRTRTRCIGAQRSDVWRLVLEVHGRRDAASARVLVNATGPWLKLFDETVLRRQAPARVRLVKGSHIVVRRLFEHDHGYIFQTGDGRVVFALPFADEFTLIGTTDRNFVGDPTGVAPDAEEIGYLCAAANGYFRAQIGPPDVIWSFAGVRSLYDDGSRKAQDTTRDYVLDLDEPGGEAPVLDSLWRQDHHLSAPRRAGARAARPCAADGPRLDRRLASAGRRIPPRRTCGVDRKHAPIAAVSFARARAAPCARLRDAGRAHARAGAADGGAWAVLRRRPDRARRCATSWTGNGRRPRTTCCGGEPSWACVFRRRASARELVVHGRKPSARSRR